MEDDDMIKKTKQLRWFVAVIVLITTVGLVQMTANEMIYFPIVMVQSYPAMTFTPTISPTPTRTPTPDTVLFVEVMNSVSDDPLDEYVSIRNYASRTMNLSGWFLRDDGPNRYDFPENFYIGRNQTVRIWTRGGVNTTTDLYWNNATEVWNDHEDCAYLRDYSGEEKLLIDIYCYKKGKNGRIRITPNPHNIVP